MADSEYIYISLGISGFPSSLEGKVRKSPIYDNQFEIIFARLKTSYEDNERRITKLG